MAFRVKLIHKGMAQVLHFPGLERNMKDRVDNVAQRAQSIAPVRTGAYRASITSYTVRHGDRIVGQCKAAVPYATQVEAARRVLGQAIDAARG